jgi:hypothetical protein
MNKEKQKEILIDIMEADSKDGLYKHQTAVEFLAYNLNPLFESMPNEILNKIAGIFLRLTKWNENK